MTGRPLSAYKGDEPYVFVSYSHDDEALVYPEIRHIQDLGFNVWWDEGISPGHSWPEELAQAITECSAFVLFITPQSVRSEHCQRETTFALDTKRPLLAIHLAETELPPGLKLSIGQTQGIVRHRETRDSFESKLIGALEEMSLLRGEATAADEPHSPTPARRFALGTVALLVLAVGAVYGFRAYQTFAEKQWARSVAVPEIVSLTRQGNYQEAHQLAVRVEARLPDDPILADLWSDFSARIVLDTTPTGADVYVKPYERPEADWQHLGRTPIDSRLAYGAYRGGSPEKGSPSRSLLRRGQVSDHQARPTSC